jgi:hypothetical protein
MIELFTPPMPAEQETLARLRFFPETFREGSMHKFTTWSNEKFSFTLSEAQGNCDCYVRIPKETQRSFPLVPLLKFLSVKNVFPTERPPLFGAYTSADHISLIIAAHDSITRFADNYAPAQFQLFQDFMTMQKKPAGTAALNADLINRFYSAFAESNAEGMVTWYHDDIIFRDPAFGELRGEKAKDMWRMLVRSAKGKIKIAWSDVAADENSGRANWRAEYVFSGTGRNVVNVISAEFEFRDGKIVRHTDSFDFYKWAKQALGWKGWLLGRTGFFRRKVMQQANARLADFQSKRS